MTNIRVTVQDQAIKNLLNIMKRKGMNMRTPYKQASYIMHADVMKRFDTESDENGVRWRPIILTRSTMKRRKMLNKNGKPIKKRAIFKILQDTGRLRGSIRPTSNAFGAEVSTKVEYAAIHNFGGRTGRGKKVTMPARPFMRAISGEAKTKIIKLFQIHLFNARD